MRREGLKIWIVVYPKEVVVGISTTCRGGDEGESKTTNSEQVGFKSPPSAPFSEMKLH